MKVQLHGGPLDQKFVYVERLYQFYVFPVMEDLPVIEIDEMHPYTSEVKKAIYRYTQSGYIFDRMQS